MPIVPSVTPQPQPAPERFIVFLFDDMHLSFGELAAGTGGTYFHNSNDLEGGFQRLTAAPEYLYLLEFSAGNVKQNGSYHRLKVKIDQDGLTLQ